MKAIIVEDEIKVKKVFIKMLEECCPDVDVIATADSVKIASTLIANSKFDVLFLDINLPDGSGFDILKGLKEYDFKVIFTTAYDQYAVLAFKMSAVDYLLKPIDPILLKNAVEKVKASASDSKNQSLKIMESNIQTPNSQENKIVLKDADSIFLVQLKDIIYCQADGGYTTFFLVNDKTIVTSTNLKEYEEMLKQYQFIRSHHSYLINLNQIVAIRKQDGVFVETTKGDLLPVSARKKAVILEKIKNTYLN